MFVRRPREAVDLLIRDLQRAVSCVTPSVLRAKVVQGPPMLARVGFQGPLPRARVGRRRERWIEINVSVEARQAGLEMEGWRTHTLRYEFALYDSPDGGPYLLAYHFHPDPERRGYQRPHLHVRARPAWAPGWLHKRHLPTSRISCEQFVRLLIEELGIRRAGSDWERVLDDTERRVQARRTW